MHICFWASYCFLAYCHMSIDRCFKILWKTWVQLCAFVALRLFLLQHGVFQNKKLSGKIIVIYQLDKAIDNVTNWNKCQHISTSWNQTVKLSTSYFTFHGKIALGQLVRLQKCLQLRCLWQRCLWQQEQKRQL